MKKGILLIALACFILGLNAQTPYIGHTVFTFNDSTRTGGFGSGGGPGRQIQCEVYYPSTSTTGGDNVPITPGQYPVLVFGHGFVMLWSAYDNIWKDLVPQGYVIAFPRTEGGFSPVHADFGKDLALVASRMIGEGSNPANFLYNHIINKSAIMGHSMGGGSSFLACAGNSSVTTMVTFAAANTNPSSITAAQNVTMPTLVIAGKNDCVAPPPANQDSMYLKTAAACKAEITIKGAAHCEFANPNTNCTFGESTCSPSPTISAAQQQSIASLYYSNWLAWFLKGDCNAWHIFNDSAATSNLIVANRNCSVTCNNAIATNNSSNFLKLYPNPCKDFILLDLPTQEKVDVEITNLLGEDILLRRAFTSGQKIMLPETTGGFYIVKIYTTNSVLRQTFMKQE